MEKCCNNVDIKTLIDDVATNSNFTRFKAIFWCSNCGTAFVRESDGHDYWPIEKKVPKMLLPDMGCYSI